MSVMKKNVKARFKFRVAGIAIRDNQILIHKSEQNLYWSLPGGRVEFLETTILALQREMLEETGLNSEIYRLVWITENFFIKDEKPVHELAFYHLMSLPTAPKNIFYGHERDFRLCFQWYNLEAIETVPLYPAFLRKALLSIPDVVEHIVISDL